MKKNSILMMLCALLTVFSVGALASCQGGGKESGTQSSVSESSESSSESNEESTSSEDSESSSESSSESDESSESSESSEDSAEPEDNTLMITAPTGEVFPYVDGAKAYLQAGEGAEVADYWTQMDNPFVPIQVKWTYDEGDAAKFLVEYATKADYSDALSVEAGATKRSVDLYNLYRGENYYVRITAKSSKGEALHTAESEFQTTSLGPRVMNIEGVHNVRDLGGYETSFGKKIVQGLAYRGGSLTDPPLDAHYSDNITEAGKKYMSEVMGIKAELDFRTPNESGVTLEEGSVIPGAELTYITLGGYSAPFTNGKEAYRKLFVYLSNENNYPMYYHCTGGADRTGTVTFLLHALLGVSELECVQGFAFTSFSIYSLRASSKGIYWQEFQDMIAQLKTYEGATLQEKTESYLLSIGVTEDQIYNIKAIFFGEPTKTTVVAPSTYMKNVDGDFVISIGNQKVPKTLYLGNVETQFSYANGKITVTPAQLPDLKNGMTDGKIIFVDETEAPFTFEWKDLNIVLLDDTFDFDANGTVTQTADRTLLMGNKAIGYGKTVCMRLETTTVEKTLGGLRVFIGSYGFEARGGEVRPYTLDSNGNMKEVVRDAGMSLSSSIFNEGGVLYMTVEFVDDKPVLTIRVEKGGLVTEYSYTFASRVANEITDANAVASFWIRVDAVTSITVYNTTAWNNKQ